jgi:hypothetical protein
MKNLWITLFIIIVNQLNAQDYFNYQAIISDSNGAVVASQSIGVQLSIIYNSTNGTVVYKELHSPTTDSNGLINLTIGTGTQLSSADFSSINWSTPYIYLKSEIDLGSGYVDVGTDLIGQVPIAIFAKQLEGITVTSGTISATGANLSGTVTATAFVGDGSGLTGISGPIYKSSMVLQESSTAATDSQIDLPGLSFRWRKDSNEVGKLEVKAESGNAPQAIIFYFSYHTNNDDTINFRPDLVSASTSSWNAVDCSWCDNLSPPPTGYTPNLPSITGSYAVYEFDFSVYPLESSGNHFGKTYNVKLFLGGWGGVHMRASYQ